MRRTALRRASGLRRRARLRARPSPPREREPAEAACLHCGATFRPRPRRRRAPALFCSRRCARLHREERRALEAPAPSPRHSRAWWRRLRAYVRARDGFRCVLCGASERELGRELSVDHVYPRRAFPRAFDAYALFGTAAFVSVCPQCHARKTGGAEAAWLRGDALRLQRYAHAVARLQGAPGAPPH